MLLLVAATEMEMGPVRALLGAQPEFAYLVAGVGPVETTLALSRFLLSEAGRTISGVVNFGVAGAFRNTELRLLDLCFAQSEVFGDFGVCYGEEIMPFDFAGPECSFTLDHEWLARGQNCLAASGVAAGIGNFVTVNGVSGTGRRGDLLRDRYRAVCENMEGAAVARVCQSFNLPVLELRCVSNLVEDRQRGSWQLQDASRQCGEAVALLLPALLV